MTFVDKKEVPHLRSALGGSKASADIAAVLSAQSKSPDAARATGKLVHFNDVNTKNMSLSPPHKLSTSGYIRNFS